MMDAKFFEDLIEQFKTGGEAKKTNLTITTKESTSQWVSKDEFERMKSERDEWKAKYEAVTASAESRGDG